MGIYYPSFRAYFEDSDTIEDRITRIDTIITALLTLMATSALEDDVSEYRLNDGQTTIGVTRRSATEIERSIMSLERLKQMYIKRINGHTFRAVNHEDTRFIRDFT